MRKERERQKQEWRKRNKSCLICLFVCSLKGGKCIRCLWAQRGRWGAQQQWGVHFSRWLRALLSRRGPWSLCNGCLESWHRSGSLRLHSWCHHLDSRQHWTNCIGTTMRHGISRESSRGTNSFVLFEAAQPEKKQQTVYTLYVCIYMYIYLVITSFLTPWAMHAETTF